MKLGNMLTRIGAVVCTSLLGTTLSVLPAFAQSSRPYVVFVNGQGNCCAWGMDSLYKRLEIQYGLTRNDFRFVPYSNFRDGGESGGGNQLDWSSVDSQFLKDGEDFLNNQLDRHRPLILIGHSYGGDSILKLLPRINRRIQIVAVIDPVSTGGFRAPLSRYRVPENVDYFFNRWQTNVIFPNDFLVSGLIASSAGESSQEEESIARNEDSSPRTTECSWGEVCPGYLLPNPFRRDHPKGRKGTKQVRVGHQDLPKSAHIQKVLGDRIQERLAAFSPPASNVQPSSTNSGNVSANLPVFDSEFYLKTYGDLRNAFGTNQGAANNHWLTYGIKEGRRSSPAFDVRYYLNSYSDLQNAFGSENYSAAINHWLTYGIKEGRRSSIAFDVKYYLNKYPDLQRAFGTSNYSAAVNHWLTYGVSEGRQGSPDFDPKFYLSSNRDVANAYGANNYKGAIEHFLEYGKGEGRRGTP